MLLNIEITMRPKLYRTINGQSQTAGAVLCSCPTNSVKSIRTRLILSKVAVVQFYTKRTPLQVLSWENLVTLLEHI